MHLCDLHFLQWLGRVSVIFGLKLSVSGDVPAPGAAASAAWKRRRDRIRQQPQRVVASSRHDFGLCRIAVLGVLVKAALELSSPEAEDQDTTVTLSAYRLLHRGVSDMWRCFSRFAAIRQSPVKQ